MATYEYSDKVKFVLPDGYVFSREDDGEGDEIIKISAGEYENDDGEKQYKFNARLLGILLDPEVEPDEDEDAVNCDNFLDKTSKQLENSKRLRISTNPDAYYINKNTPMTFFGIKIKAFSTMLMARVSEYELINIVATSVFNDEDDSENDAVYENMFEILKSIRINGKKLQLENVTPHYLRSAVQLSFDEESSEAIDISPKISLAFGNQKAVYEYSEGNINEISKSQLNYAEPDKALYPHYKSKLSVSGLGSLLGVQVVVNASGTEYEFISLDRLADDDEFDEEQRSLYQRIIAKDTEEYSLDQKAKALQKLFRVNKDAFDCNHDRECEIEQGYLHRAYMFSALRSFSWTLADLCRQTGCTPENIDLSDIKRIVSFIADNDWLNYDDETHCKGLCSGSDLHVFYIPDSVSKADKQELMPSQEDFDRVKTMKERFPNYREILSEVHSLNELRKDLSYIYPAIETLWKALAENRDYSEPLTGNEADIVYAWCSLARAAKKPFFTEDGPMRCFFSQLDDEESFSEYIAPVSEQSCIPKSDSSNVKTLNSSDNIVYAPDMETPICFLSTDDDEKVLEGFFDDCQVSDLVIPDGIIKIESFAFDGCLELEKVFIPDSVTEIEGWAFSSCYNLREVVIPESVTSIGDYVFEDDVVIKAPKGSYAEEYAEDNDLEFVPVEIVKREPLTAPKVTKTKSQKMSVSGSIKESVPKATPMSSFELDGKNKLTKFVGTETEVVIPDGITKIGSFAFDDCSDLKKVFIPDSVTEIEKWAFSDCTNLISIVIPSSVTEIGEYAFNGCTGLESINISACITKIDDSTFSDCTALKSITIPDGVNSIGNSAFDGCTSLTSITVPESVSEIGLLAFPNDAIIYGSQGSFAEKYAVEKNLCFNIEQYDKNIFDISGTMLNSYSGNDPEVKIPFGVATIGSSAFSECESLESIVIPDSVTAIEYCAFSGCTNLRHVVIPDSVTTIGFSAFSECKNLESIVIPDSVTEISDYLFLGCTNLKSVVLPNSITVIGDAAFSECKNLEGIELSDNVVSIGETAFTSCEKLADKNGFVIVRNVLYSYHGNDTSVVVPADIEKIDRGAFEKCNNITNIVIPETTKEIGHRAFCGCGGLADEQGFVIIRNVLYSYHGDATLITIPDGIIRIDGAAFCDCTNIESVCIPDCVIEIGDAAFKNCTSLKSVNIPDSIIKIEGGAFSDCVNLECITLPERIVEIEWNTFSGCENLRSIIVPENVTKIGGCAFENCSNLESITLPEGVIEIEYHAFWNCASLGRVIVPESVENIGFRAFEGCEKITICAAIGSVAEKYAKFEKIRFSEYLTEEQISARRLEEERVKKEEEEKRIIVEKMQTYKKDGFVIDNNVLTSYTGNAKEVIIPDCVTEIGKEAFCGNRTIESVFIPGTVKRIGTKAFAECVFPKLVLDNGIIEISDMAFMGNSYLKEIDIPDSVRFIGTCVFEDCMSVEFVKIPDSVETIGEGTFAACIEAVDKDGFLIIRNTLCSFYVKDTKSASVPENVTIIDRYAFLGDEDILEIEVPESVVEIRKQAFAYCDVLEKVTIHNDSVVIHSEAFYKTKNVTIVAHTGSTAEKFAKENDIKFEAYLTEEQKEAIRREEEAKRLAEEKARKEAEERRLREEEERRIAEEQRIAEEKRRVEERNRIAAERKAAYDALVVEKEQLLQTIAENKGLFGEKARRRKDAKQKLEEVETKLAAYPEFAQ